mmetsp:Transcript_21186/g.54625  ORF Transcript_21186/g.54625 Transcript_21186/m.54625 type:complete len:420 (-) Transcript_21186:315-1574(-)
MSAFTTASDIWSVGCTVLELLTGVPPYFELTQMSAMYHIVNDEHPPLPDGLSDDLRGFLLACFERDVKRRPTAHQLRQHPWLTTTTRSVLALGEAASVPQLPDFLTRTVDKETSWLSSNGSHRSYSSAGEAMEAAPAGDGPLARPRSRPHLPTARGAARERLVGADDAQRRLAAAAGVGTSALAGAPAGDVIVRIGTDAERASPSAAAAAALSGSEPPLCGFLWKRGTSALGKLAYYKRYFYVKDGALCYCSGRSDSTIQPNLEKRIPLTSISAVEISAQQRFEFAMHCDTRSFQFRARTLREMQVWVNTLQALRQRHEGIIAATSAPRRRHTPQPGPALGLHAASAEVAGDRSQGHRLPAGGQAAAPPVAYQLPNAAQLAAGRHSAPFVATPSHVPSTYNAPHAAAVTRAAPAVATAR